MTKKNIAVIWGGYSSEKEVSERSAQGIYSFLNKSIYNVIKVCIDHNEWTAQFDNQSFPIDKNDFSFTAESKNIKFHFA